MKLTTEDFDKAVSAPWAVHTCLIAQMVARELNAELAPNGCQTCFRMETTDGREVALTREMQDVQGVFDYAWRNLSRDDSRGEGLREEQESDLFFLRAMLPIDFS